MGSTIDRRSRSIATTAKNKYALIKAFHTSPLLHSIKILWLAADAAAAAANEWSRQTKKSKLQPHPSNQHGGRMAQRPRQSLVKMEVDWGDINGMSDVGSAGASGKLSSLHMRSGTATVRTSGAVTIRSGSSASGSGGNIAISVKSSSDAGYSLSIIAGDATRASNDEGAASMVIGSLFTNGDGSLTQQELVTQLKEMQQLTLVLKP